MPAELDYTSNKLSDYACENWNASIFTKADSHLESISVSFEPFTKFAQCFHSYELYLYKLWTKDCNPYKGYRISAFEISSIDQRAVRSFQNVKAGFYCTLVVPCKKYACIEEWALSSSAVHIIGRKKDELNPETFVPDQRILAVFISVALVILFLTAVGLFLLCKYKKHKWVSKTSSKITSVNNELGKDTIDGSVEQPLIPKSSQIVIFYSHENGAKENVKLLKDFLTNCAKEDVILDEDVMEEIMIEPTVWLGDVCGSNKRLIIVLSQTAAHYLTRQSMNSTAEKGSLNHLSKIAASNHDEGENFNDDEVEEVWFKIALSFISTNWERCLRDYRNLFVVCFDYDSSLHDGLKNMVPRVCYSIPDQLIDLCMNLNPVSECKNSERRRELSDYLEKHPIRNVGLNEF